MKSEKITGRWYDDACGTALALELLGERWSMLIVRELMFGPRRFGELRGGLPGISANVLTQRLEGLAAAGVVVRRTLPSPANVQVYELTPWGYEADVAIMELGRWAARSPDHDPTLPLSAASLMLSFRTMVQAGRASGHQLTIAFALGADRFMARVADGGLRIVRGEAESTDARIVGAPEAIAGSVYGGAPVDGWGEALRIEGDRDAALRFFALFELPAKAGVATQRVPA